MRRVSRGVAVPIPALLALGALLAAPPAWALNSIEEGPWQIFECVESNGVCMAGTFLGEGWATDPGTGAAWTEFDERTANWSFVAAGSAWYVTVPSKEATLALALTCPTNGVNCQKVGTSTPDTFRPKPTYAPTPDSGTQSYVEWHPAGKYAVTAFINSGTGTTKTAYYYVSGDPTSTTRAELICSPSGFRWPGRSDAAGDPVVSWRVKLVDGSAPPSSCPLFWKKTEFTVNLNP